MTKKSMRYLAPVLAMSMVLSLTACGGGEKAAETTAAAAAGNDAAAATTAAAAAGNDAAPAKDTLVIATANETPSMTTNLHNAVAGDYMNKMTHNCLFLQDADMNIVPDLCESYEIVSDTEWVFKLHQGVKFHNGAEMKAADVVASINQCKESPEVAQYGKAIASIEAVDDYTVKIITDGPQSGLLSDLTHHGNAILPADLIASGHDFNKEPIGTGPYVFKEWKKGESVTLEAFDDYFKGEAPIETVIWKIIPEGSSRTMALEAGEVDLIVEVESTDVSRLKDNANVTVFDDAGTSHNFMMINNEKAPFNNKDFRHAMNCAIDKAAIVQVALNGGGSTCDSMLPTCFPGATNEGASTFDPEKAKEYFAASGLNAADCGFDLICSDDTKLRVGQVIQACLKETLGVDITLQSMDLATYLDVTATGDYDAAIGGYTSSGMLPYAQGVWHSASINSSNKTRTADPHVDELIEKMQATVDPAANEAIVTELNKYLNEEMPQIALYMRNNTRAYAADLKGFNVNAGGNTDYSLFSWN